MELSELFPVWDKLTPAQQTLVAQTLVSQAVPKGQIVHNGSMTCSGLLLVQSGQLRAYSLSDEGRELTLYRLFDRDICLFSASCIMRSIQFDVIIQAEKDSQICFVPPQVFKQLMEQSAPVANFTNELMATRFSEVMWLMEQIMWKSMDKRLAAFLLEECNIEDTRVLKITHEAIANHIGTHREVITRMLRYFQSEDMVRLTRGTVEILNEDKLRKLDR